MGRVGKKVKEEEKNEKERKRKIGISKYWKGEGGEEKVGGTYIRVHAYFFLGGRDPSLGEFGNRHRRVSLFLSLSHFATRKEL